MLVERGRGSTLHGGDIAPPRFTCDAVLLGC